MQNTGSDNVLIIQICHMVPDFMESSYLETQLVLKKMSFLRQAGDLVRPSRCYSFLDIIKEMGLLNRSCLLVKLARNKILIDSRVGGWGAASKL